METNQTAVEQVKSLNQVEFNEIDSTCFFSMMRTKHLGLVEPKEGFKYKLKEDRYDFCLATPHYIGKIQFFGKGSLPKLKLEVKLLNGKDATETIYSSKIEGGVEFEVNRIISGFDIYPQRSTFSFDKIHLSKVVCEGFSLEDADMIDESFSEYVNLKDRLVKEFSSLEKEYLGKKQSLDEREQQINNKIGAFENNVSEREERISELEESEKVFLDKVSVIKQEHEEESSKLADIKEKLKSTLEKNEKLSRHNLELTDKIQVNQEKNKTLNKEIGANELKLKELLENNNVFSEEFSSFNERNVEEIEYHLKWLIFFGSMLALIGLPCFGFLGYLAYTSPQDIGSVLINRMPVATVAILLLNLFYNLFRERSKIVDELKIAPKKLITIGHISKQASEEIAAELDLSDEEKFDLKFKAKMDMLKGYLAAIVGDAYEYKENKLNSLQAIVKSFNDARKKAREDEILKNAHADSSKIIASKANIEDEPTTNLEQ